MRFDNQLREKILDTKSFLDEATALLNALVDAELEKDDNEIDFDFINECTDILLEIESDGNIDDIVFALSSDKILEKEKTLSLKTARSYARGILVVAIILTTTISGFAMSKGVDPVEQISKFMSSISATQEDKVQKETTLTITTTKAPTTQKKVKAQVTKESQEKTSAPSVTHKKTETTKRLEPQQTTTQHVTIVDNNSAETTEPTTHKINMDTAQYMELCFDKKVKRVYHVGESINCFGMSVKIHYTDDYVVKMPVKYCTITGFDTSKVGECVLTISYKNVSQNFTITVIE